MELMRVFQKIIFAHMDFVGKNIAFQDNKKLLEGKNFSSLIIQFS